MDNRRILIIDDDPEILKVYYSILVPDDALSSANAEMTRLLLNNDPGEGHDAKRGFELDSALQGEEGLALVRQALAEGRPYALAFIDVRMPPGWDGMKTAAQIREIDPDIELVVVTAYSDRSLSEIVESVGTPDKLLFLRKPFDPEEVSQMALSLSCKWNLARKSEVRRHELEECIGERTVELEAVNKELHEKICEQKRAKKALLLVYDEFYQIFDTAADGMQVIDKDYTIVRVNEAFADLVRLDKKNIIGRKCYEVLGGPACHTEDCPLHQVMNGSPRIEYEEERRRTDGTTVPIIITSYPFREPDGELIGIVSSIKDITKWKNVEQTLRAFAADLERSNNDLQNFANTVSHDLQEPLMLIRSFGKRLLEKHSDGLNDKAQEYLARIDSSAKRMQDLINDLLIFSRVSTGRGSFRPVDLSAAIEDVISDLEMRIRATGGQVEAGVLPTIDADPMQMHQLFLNLIGNALKYHRPGCPPKIRITGRQNYDPELGREVCTVSVEDNGIGFKDIYAHKIFCIFQRLHDRRKYEGTGIGLAICKRIVEHHGGTIGAKSTPGEGSEFSVTLPVRQEPQLKPDSSEFAFSLHASLSEIPAAGQDTPQ